MVAPSATISATARPTIEHFHRAMEHKAFAPDAARPARAYVDAYVQYAHDVERLREDASGSPHGHHGHGVAQPAGHAH